LFTKSRISIGDEVLHIHDGVILTEKFHSRSRLVYLGLLLADKPRYGGAKKAKEQQDKCMPFQDSQAGR
jgi:hypothetical protein